MKESYQPGNKERKLKKRRRIVIWLFILLLITGSGSFYAYLLFLAPNIYISDNKNAYLEIPTGSSFEDVKAILYSKDLIIQRRNFELVAKLKKYDQNVKPGRYLLSDYMNNIKIVNKLRSGNQDPVKVTFNSVRFADQLASNVSKQIEADSLSLITLMTDSLFLDSIGVTPLSLFTTMIPNTYEFYWNTSARSFMRRMKTESDKFWNKDRIRKMNELGLTKQQVITLASIVEKETNMNDEKARVAGVYVNRLKKGWLLEADPTLVFAHGNFEIKRVLNVLKEIDSPYNTYKYAGLPPGPICLPSISSIDAALNPEPHNYMFFCAKEDFSGYHSFAVTLEQHNLNAFRYQQALNQRKIMR